MRTVMKRHGKAVTAYRLGDNSPALAALIQEGKIIPLENEEYEIMSQEAVNGGSEHGELARIGDYVKIDSSGYPYPNSAAFFAENHRHIAGDAYEQIPRPLLAWTANEPMCPEIEFLLKEGRLKIHEDDSSRYYSAALWGTLECAAKDAVIVFYEITTDSKGSICDISFNFVARDEFDKTYNVIE